MTLKNKTVILICCLLFCGKAILIGQHSISIEIYDSDTNNPVDFASVYIQPNNKMELSDKEGIATFRAIEDGNISIKVNHINYHEFSADTTLNNKSRTIKIFLVPRLIIGTEILVSANRKKESLKNTAASIHVLSKIEIKDRGILSFDQALDQIPGVYISRSGAANIQGLSIRGASEVAGGGNGNRVLLMIDGRPAISPESGGALWNLVPTLAIDQIEVLKGPYSALYGSSAMGGVIQVFTRKPTLSTSTKVQSSIGFYENSFGYDEELSKRMIYSTEVNRSGRFKGMGYMLDLGFKHNGGHRQNTSFDQTNIMAKFDFDINDQLNMTFTSGFNKVNNETPATWLKFSSPWAVADHRLDDSQERGEKYAMADLENQNGSRGKDHHIVYFYQNKLNYIFNSDPKNDSTNVNFGKQHLDAESILANQYGYSFITDRYTQKGDNLIIGADIKYDYVNGKPDIALYGIRQAIQSGLYTQFQFLNLGLFTLDIGLRYDYYKIISGYNGGNVNPKISFAYRLGKNLKFRGLIAQSFRQPSISERYIQFEQGGGLRFQPNPELKAEKINFSSEVGVKWNNETGYFLDASIYYNHYKDLISYLRLTTPDNSLLYKVVNLRSAEMSGFELQIGVRKKNHFYRLGYHYLNAKDKSDNRINDDLAYKPKHTITGLAQIKMGRFVVIYDLLFRSKIEEVFIYPGNEPDFAFLQNLKLDWNFADKQNLFVSVKNLSNFAYEDLERYRMPGRHFISGFTLDF